MKAVGLTKASTDFVDIEIDKPVPENHDLLVKIKAISINPVDTKQREAAKLSGEEVRILGWDAVGEVVDTGSELHYFKLDKTFISQVTSQDQECTQNTL